MNGFRKYFVHPTFDCSINVFVFNVTCHSDDLWLAVLFYVHLVEQFSYFGCAGITIHYWHIAVHKDKRILKWFIIINRFLNLLETLLTIKCKFTDILSIAYSQNHKETINYITIKFLVVTHYNLATHLTALISLMPHKIGLIAKVSWRNLLHKLIIIFLIS